MRKRIIDKSKILRIIKNSKIVVYWSRSENSMGAYFEDIPVILINLSNNKSVDTLIKTFLHEIYHHLISTKFREKEMKREEKSADKFAKRWYKDKDVRLSILEKIVKEFLR